MAVTYDQIEQYAGAALRDGASAEVIAELLSKAEEVRVDHERVTTTDLLRLLTPDEYDRFDQVIETGAKASRYVTGVNRALDGKGLDLSLDESQQFVESHRAAFGDVITDKLKAVGVTRTPAVGPVTADEVAAAIAERKLSDRVVNAHALAMERMDPLSTAQEQAEIWAKAWEDAV